MEPGLNETKIAFCGCEHKFQDKRYGPHKRVHIICPGPTAYLRKMRCTVCGTEKPTSAK